MPDSSVDNLERDLGRLVSRGGGAEPSPAVQIRRQLRGKHVCPFCGTTRETDVGPCQHCSLEDTPTTRSATRSKLGPWYVLQSRNPSAPGMNFATLQMLIQKGRVTARSVLRGPTTGQFWRHAAKVKGVAREFGLCWNCGGDVARSARACPSCKRMQEPPMNPDVLLEPGELSAEDLTEQMWAADAPSSQVGHPPVSAVRAPAGASPVDRLAHKGGVRREVPAAHPYGDDVPPYPSESPAPRRPVARNGNGNGHGPAGRLSSSREADDLVSTLSAGTTATSPSDSFDDLTPRARRPVANPSRPPQVGGPAAYAGGPDGPEALAPGNIEMAVYQQMHGRGARGGLLIGKFFKVLFIALLIGGAGLGALCYLDESIRARTLAYWEQAVEWGKSLANNRRAPSDPTTVTKAGKLFDDAVAAEGRHEFDRALELYGEIDALHLAPDALPKGFKTKYEAAKRRADDGATAGREAALPSNPR